MTQLYDDALAPCGIRVTQFALLRTLARRGVLTISTLADLLLLDRTALSRNLDPLLDRGLVEVVAGADARTREVSLTAAGHRSLRRAEPLWETAQKDVAQRIGASRLATLYALLEDLERLHPARSAAPQPLAREFR